MGKNRPFGEYYDNNTQHPPITFIMPTHSNQDLETELIKHFVTALEALDVDLRTRIVRYLGMRYDHDCF